MHDTSSGCCGGAATINGQIPQQNHHDILMEVWFGFIFGSIFNLVCLLMCISVVDLNETCIFLILLY